MAGKLSMLLSANTQDPVVLALAAVIREERLRCGWSPAQLADRSGVRRQTIEAIEANVNRPRVDTERRIARALGLQGSELEARAERRAAHWPEICARCNYFCISHGELRWLNSNRECVRPKP